MGSTGEYSWDSFPAEGVKGQKNGGDQKRRHDDLPRYYPPGNNKPRHFNNRSGTNGRTQEMKNGEYNPRGPHYRHENRGPVQQNRKPRTSSDNYDERPKSGPKNNSRPPFRNNGTSHNNGVNHNVERNNRNLQNRLEPAHEKEMRMQIMRMRGHVQYLRDQMAYKDQVVHHKEQVIIALRAKLEKLKVGSSENEGPSSSPVEPEKPEDFDKMEADMHNDVGNVSDEGENGAEHECENGDSSAKNGSDPTENEKEEEVVIEDKSEEKPLEDSCVEAAEEAKEEPKAEIKEETKPTELEEPCEPNDQPKQETATEESPEEKPSEESESTNA